MRFLGFGWMLLDVGGCVTSVHNLLKSKTVSETEQKTLPSTVSRKSQLRPRPSPWHTPAPLERGDFGWCYILGNKWFVVWDFPSWEGMKGCVTVRSAGWVEMIFAAVWRGGITGSRFWCCEVVSAGLQWEFLILGGCAHTSHTPCLSEVPPKSWTKKTIKTVQ